MSASIRMFMRWVPVWLAGLAAAACTAGGSTSLPVSHHAQIYHDSGGWSIKVPPGWHAVRFSDTKNSITSAGAQVSNVRLPPPSLVPGFPIQVKSGVLPAHGIGLIIATDADPGLSHGPVETPPLPAPNGRYWSIGSSLAGEPYIETLWFRVHGLMFIVCAKIGSQVTSRELIVLAAVVRSVR